MYVSKMVSSLQPRRRRRTSAILGGLILSAGAFVASAVDPAVDAAAATATATAEESAQIGNEEKKRISSDEVLDVLSEEAELEDLVEKEEGGGGDFESLVLQTAVAILSEPVTTTEEVAKPEPVTTAPPAAEPIVYEEDAEVPLDLLATIPEEFDYEEDYPEIPQDPVLADSEVFGGGRGIGVQACLELDDGTVQCDLNRKQADWRPWPARSVRKLKVYSNLCEESGNNWPKALNKANKQWNKFSLGNINLEVQQDNCDTRLDQNLTYVKDAIHVVFGTCGKDCCGKADVEYFYNTRGEITRYSALVRIDRTCFGNGADFNGLKYIMCHEMGHAIGLAHEYDVGSCMGNWDDGSKPGRNDVKTLLSIYGQNKMIAMPRNAGGRLRGRR